jgi:glycerol-3-phosphate O-acyltransferase/dihydroxyacetone phosphate acyltransferase
VGIKYFKPYKFRSKVIVEFSRPHRIPQSLVEDYKVKERKRDACSTLLKAIEGKMREVTLSAPSYEALQNIYLARDIYMPSDSSRLSDKDINEIYKRFFKGFSILKGMPEAKVYLENIELYRKELKAFNLRDHDVNYLKMNFCIIIYNFFYSVCMILFYLSFALIGLAILEPLGMYNSITGETARREALAGSVVKVVGVDVIASHKLVNTFKILPVLFSVITAIYYFTFSAYLGGDSVVKRMMHSCVFFVFCPLYAYMCIIARDNLKRHLHVLKSRFYCFFYTEHVLTIQGMRNNLKKTIRELVNTKGPEIFKDFDEIKKKQVEKLYRDDKSSSSHQLEIELEVDEALDSLKELGM